MLSRTEWAYLAGLIDGEGSITIMRQKGKPAAVRVRFNNTDEAVIEWVISRFGGLKCEANSNSSYGKKICHRLDWNSVNAIPILEGVLPFLVIKKQLALIALEYLALTGRQRTITHPCPTDAWNKREALCEVASILNGKKYKN